MLGVAHGALLLLLLMLPLWTRLMLAALVLSSLVYYLRRDAWLRAPDSCIGLVLQGDDAILNLRNGAQLRGEIAPDSLVTPLLTVLNVSLPELRATRSVVMLPDSMAADVFRQLRVWLKWGRSGHAVAGRRQHGGRG